MKTCTCFSKCFPCSDSLQPGKTPLFPPLPRPRCHLFKASPPPSPPDGCDPFCLAYELTKRLWVATSALLPHRWLSDLLPILETLVRLHQPRNIFLHRFFRRCGPSDFCICAASSSGARTSVPTGASRLPDTRVCGAACGAGAAPSIWMAFPSAPTVPPAQTMPLPSPSLATPD